jgi:hypothetical protein
MFPRARSRLVALQRAARPSSRPTIAAHSPLQASIPKCLYAEWKGTRKESHGQERIKRGDTTDPETKAMDIGEKERAESNKTPDETKSQATTEKPRRRTKEDTESEFPEAPKPAIGMEDERGRVRILKSVAR